MIRTSGNFLSSSVCAILLVVALWQPVLAIDTYWNTPATGDWTNIANWSAGVPTAADNAYLGRNATVSLTTAQSATYVLIGHTNAPNNGNGTLEINPGATLNLSAELYAQYQNGASGTVNQLGGTVNAGSNVRISNGGVVGTGLYQLSGGSLNFTGGSKILDIANQGTFDFIGGSITGSPSVQVGSGTGNNTATFNLNGNSLSAFIVEVDRSSALKTVADQFNFQGGTVTTSAHFLVGGSNAVGGTVVTLGANEKLNVGSLLYVGYTDSPAFDQLATFNHNGGGTGQLNIAQGINLSNGQGTNRDYFNQNSGVLNFTGSATIDIVNEGTFNFNGGSIAGTPSLKVGSGGSNYKAIFNLGGNTASFANVDIDRSAGLKLTADEFNFQNGTVNTTGYFLLGGSNGPGGTVVNLNANDTLNVGNLLYVGYSDSLADDQMATFNHNGGGTGQLNIGQGINLSNGQGTNRDFFNQNSGDLHFTGAFGKTIDIVNAGTFNFNGGTITGSPDLKIGSGTGDYKAIFNLNGKTMNAGLVDFDRGAGPKNIADEFNFQGGTLSTSAYFLVGGSNAPGGTVLSLNTGDTLNTGTELYVGYVANGTATFEVNGGTLNIGSTLRLNEPGTVPNSFFTLNSGAVTFTGGSREIQLIGPSKMEVKGGTISGVQNVNVGHGAAGLAVYEQSGGTTNINGQVVVSFNGTTTGEFNLSGGTFTMNNPADFYLYRTSSANISGTGTLNLSRNLLIGNIAGATADFNQSGGTVNVKGNVQIAEAAGLTGSYNLSGGTLNLTTATSDLLLQRDATMNISGGEANLPRNFQVGTMAGFNAVVTQTDGRVNVANTLSLASIAGANGTYNLSGGELKVGTLDLTNPGNDAFNLNGGKLSAVVVDNADGVFSFTSGMLSPGLVNTPATMTFNTGLVFPAAGGLQMDLTTENVLGGGVNDLLVINGNLTLDGILSVEGTSEGDYPFLTFTGSLTDLGMQPLFPLTQSIFVVMNPGGGGTVWLHVLPVPEPSTFALLGLGALCLRRRRRAARAVA